MIALAQVVEKENENGAPLGRLELPDPLLKADLYRNCSYGRTTALSLNHLGEERRFLAPLPSAEGQRFYSNELRRLSSHSFDSTESCKTVGTPISRNLGATWSIGHGRTVKRTLIDSAFQASASPTTQ